ncbi:MAG TPA: uracil-DNA glycosylase family protein [Polyangiaceae bacterium]|nr:uracil-DNA glycosylase family protein [Polyangiaceae bacterium]
MPQPVAPPDAPLMLVGEQPGDSEDRKGEPFVGPAGRLPSALAQYVVATVHPSSILRAPDDETREAEMRAFVDDLFVVARLLRGAQAKRA